MYIVHSSTYPAALRGENSQVVGAELQRGGVRGAHGAPWARAANFVKKPPIIVNATYLELNDLNAPMWVS